MSSRRGASSTRLSTKKRDPSLASGVKDKMSTKNASFGEASKPPCDKENSVVSAPSHLPRKVSLLTNMQLRTLTVVTVAPAMLYYATISHETATSLVCLGLFVSGLEYEGLKRHIKVRLLFPVATQGAPAKEAPPPPLPSVEYPYPVTSYWSFSAIQKALEMMLIGILAYLGQRSLFFAVCFFFLSRVSPIMWRGIFVRNKLFNPNYIEEENSREGSRSREESRSSSGPSPPLLSKENESGEVNFKQMRRDFFKVERFIHRNTQTLETVVDLSLDLFGVVWIGNLATPLIYYPVNSVARPWAFSSMIGNFSNDIVALLIGKTLRYLRDWLKTHESRFNQSALVHLFILRFPHALCPSISPNKSLEGAIAGVLANSFSFALTQSIAYRFFCTAPPPEVFLPFYNTLPVWLLVGAALGVFGVFGDLLQSLVKRAARVKDAGYCIPGHGGMLDRFDGMLLNFALLFVITDCLLYRSSSLASAAAM